MSKTVRIEYQVTLTFDVDVKGDSNVYKEISKLLESEGLIQSIGSDDLPENIYFGIRVGDTPYEGETLTQGDIKARAARINNYYWKLVDDFFNSKKLTHKVFVSTARRTTTATKYSK
ncbi:hypothetical protein LDY77_18175 [Serratia marcescens]|uniref:hypothetical protein n=1 Tax=Serratia marcescens TaxID=615 RepID=UPI001CDB56CF|nr:hypothetical protein [Serratia marcescens]MCA4112496.1 hypothetical protein [Serratia marcescens]